jgi:Zn-dependent protease
MDVNHLIDGLIQYLSLVILLTFHEYGHAWMASKCGDDTARHLGRCSLNPLVHIDPIGTVLIPLLQLLVPGVGGILIGWAKPVPFNPANLRNEKVDDVLISMAGPWMNLMLAVLFIGLAKVGVMLHAAAFTQFCGQTAVLSLVLCFFNLIPIPPLDGSHVMRVVTGMSRETYYQLARYGFIVLILIINITPITRMVGTVVFASARIMASWFGIGYLFV